LEETGPTQQRSSRGKTGFTVRLHRANEWTALVASIREKYRNRPRFMDLLDGLEGRSIVQSARTRRK